MDKRAEAAIAEIEENPQIADGERAIDIISRHFAESDPLIAKLEALAEQWESVAYACETSSGGAQLKNNAAELRKLIAESKEP